MKAGRARAMSLLACGLAAAQITWAGRSTASEVRYERQTREALRETRRSLSTSQNAPPPAPASLAKGLGGYVAYALRHSPGLKASFEQWRSMVHRISRARKLPEPMISYGVFLLNVETRVGPQRQKLALTQSFPWPTKLTAGAEAMAANARAAQRRFEARSLMIQAAVAQAYWRLWLVRKTRAIKQELLDVVRSSSEAVRARVVLGGASLAEQQQVDLFIARFEDAIASLAANERAAAADLVATIGAPVGTPTPTSAADPPVALPAESEADLQRAALRHPLLLALDLQAEGSDAQERSFEADRFPSLTLGVDWVEVDHTAMPDVADSGQDALMFGVGLKIPLWQSVYKDNMIASRAEAAGFRAQKRASSDRALADVTAALSQVRDTYRRIELHRGTLIPQAQTAFGSVVGAYATGRSSVVSVLMAQRDLLELTVGLAKAQTEHAMGWAMLEQKTGRSIRGIGDNQGDQNDRAGQDWGAGPLAH